MTIKTTKIKTGNSLSMAQAVLLLQKLKGKDRLKIGDHKDDYTTIDIKKYNEHYFLVIYTESFNWRYAYLSNTLQTARAIMGDHYKGISTSIYYLDHPEEYERMEAGKVFGKLREFINCELPERLNGFIFSKCSQKTPVKPMKQLTLF